MKPDRNRVQKQEPRQLTTELLREYESFLQNQERAPATIQKYMADLQRFFSALQGRPITKECIVSYKAWLLTKYTASSANSILAAVNGLLAFARWPECRVKRVRVQHSAYEDGGRVLTKGEYRQLLYAARHKEDMRLYYLLQTICSTGIRVSELAYITVQAVRMGRAQVQNKGKCRTVFLPRQLCKKLSRYCQERGIQEGSVFVTRGGKPLDRSNIWAQMKALCGLAGVAARKVFPHNLRHLFARLFYQSQHDLDHLAAILGHSNINTTRIYTRSTGEEHRRQIEQLRLVI